MKGYDLSDVTRREGMFLNTQTIAKNNKNWYSIGTHQSHSMQLVGLKDPFITKIIGLHGNKEGSREMYDNKGLSQK